MLEVVLDMVHIELLERNRSVDFVGIVLVVLCKQVLGPVVHKLVHRMAMHNANCSCVRQGVGAVVRQEDGPVVRQSDEAVVRKSDADDVRVSQLEFRSCFGLLV